MMQEAQVLATGAGVVRRDDRVLVAARGEDRADYLHRMLTQDVLGLAPGHARSACLLTPRGRVLADPLVWNAGERLCLDLPGEAREARETLEKYVILEDVAFAQEPTARLDVIGPGAPEALGALGLPVPGRGTLREIELGGGPVHLLHADLGRRPRFVLWLAPETRPAALDALALPLCPRPAYDLARVEEGVPAFGPELGGEMLFNEAGLEEAVSWSKGCFPGQEPVVMALDRGHPPRWLCVLAAAAREAPAGGTPLLLDGTERGRVTSSVVSERLGGVRALGYVHHAAAHVGTELEAAGGGRLRIVRVRRLTRG